MSTLNICLHNVALCRKAMPEEFEKMIHNKLTLTDIRKVIASIGSNFSRIASGTIATPTTDYIAISILHHIFIIIILALY